MAEVLFRARLTRDEPTVPWGFRLQGGADFERPLTILKVVEDSIACRCGLQAGDCVVKLAGRMTHDMTHKDAQEAIIMSQDALEIIVERGDDAAFSPFMSDEDSEEEEKTMEQSERLTMRPNTENAMPVVEQLDGRAKPPPPCVESDLPPPPPYPERHNPPPSYEDSLRYNVMIQHAATDVPERAAALVPEPELPSTLESERDDELASNNSSSSTDSGICDQVSECGDDQGEVLVEVVREMSHDGSAARGHVMPTTDVNLSEMMAELAADMHNVRAQKLHSDDDFTNGGYMCGSGSHLNTTSDHIATAGSHMITTGGHMTTAGGHMITTGGHIAASPGGHHVTCSLTNMPSSYTQNISGDMTSYQCSNIPTYSALQSVYDYSNSGDKLAPAVTSRSLDRYGNQEKLLVSGNEAWSSARQCQGSEGSNTGERSSRGSRRCRTNAEGLRSMREINNNTRIVDMVPIEIQYSADSRTGSEGLYPWRCGKHHDSVEGVDSVPGSNTPHLDTVVSRAKPSLKLVGKRIEAEGLSTLLYPPPGSVSDPCDPSDWSSSGIRSQLDQSGGVDSISPDSGIGVSPLVESPLSSEAGRVQGRATGWDELYRSTTEPDVPEVSMPAVKDMVEDLNRRLETIAAQHPHLADPEAADIGMHYWVTPPDRFSDTPSSSDMESISERLGFLDPAYSEKLYELESERGTPTPSGGKSGSPHDNGGKGGRKVHFAEPVEVSVREIPPLRHPRQRKDPGRDAGRNALSVAQVKTEMANVELDLAKQHIRNLAQSNVFSGLDAASFGVGYSGSGVVEKGRNTPHSVVASSCVVTPCQGGLTVRSRPASMMAVGRGPGIRNVPVSNASRANMANFNPGLPVNTHNVPMRGMGSSGLDAGQPTNTHSAAGMAGGDTGPISVQIKPQSATPGATYTLPAAAPGQPRHFHYTISGRKAHQPPTISYSSPPSYEESMKTRLSRQRGSLDEAMASMVRAAAEAHSANRELSGRVMHPVAVSQVPQQYAENTWPHQGAQYRPSSPSYRPSSPSYRPSSPSYRSSSPSYRPSSPSSPYGSVSPSPIPQSPLPPGAFSPVTAHPYEPYMPSPHAGALSPRGSISFPISSSAYAPDRMFLSPSQSSLSSSDHTSPLSSPLLPTPRYLSPNMSTLDPVQSKSFKALEAHLLDRGPRAPDDIPLRVQVLGQPSQDTAFCVLQPAAIGRPFTPSQGGGDTAWPPGMEPGVERRYSLPFTPPGYAPAAAEAAPPPSPGQTMLSNVPGVFALFDKAFAEKVLQQWQGQAPPGPRSHFESETYKLVHEMDDQQKRHGGGSSS